MAENLTDEKFYSRLKVYLNTVIIRDIQGGMAMRKMEDFSEVNLSPKIICEIQEIGKKHGISRIVLFGSRARKTNWEKSDIDLMISTPDSAVQLDFIDSLEEIDTLLMFDVVNRKSFNYSSVLNAEIMRDGVIIYEEI